METTRRTDRKSYKLTRCLRNRRRRHGTCASRFPGSGPPRKYGSVLQLQKKKNDCNIADYARQVARCSIRAINGTRSPEYVHVYIQMKGDGRMERNKEAIPPEETYSSSFLIRPNIFCLSFSLFFPATPGSSAQPYLHRSSLNIHRNGMS